MLNFWVSRFYVKSISYTMKLEDSMSKICPFFSASAFASCAFLLFLSNNQSFGNLLVRWNLCHLASLKQTYTTLLTIPMHKDLSRGTLFLSKTCSQDSTPCTAFQCGRDSEATRRSCHHSTWKLRKQTQKLPSVRNALFNHFCIFIQQINTPSASVSFSQTRSIQTRGKFNSWFCLP